MSNLLLESIDMGRAFNHIVIKSFVVFVGVGMASSNAQGAWRGWKKFWPSIDPTNPKTWRDLGDSIADVCHWGPGQSWLPKDSDSPTIYVGWNGAQMPFCWQRMNNAWQNPQNYGGMMTTRGDVWVVQHDFIPLISEVESHSEFCIEMAQSLESLKGSKDSGLISIHTTVMQMDEEGCTNVPDWARNASHEGKNVLNCLANTDWSQVKFF